MRHRISAAVDVEAPPDAVWAVLTDLPGHAAWNPFIPSAAGTVAPGEPAVAAAAAARRPGAAHPAHGHRGGRRRRPRVAGPPRRPRAVRRPAPLRADRDAGRHAPGAERVVQRPAGAPAARIPGRRHAGRVPGDERRPARRGAGPPELIRRDRPASRRRGTPAGRSTA
ncbi:SRPBCC family protein [Blastococcus sp. TML/C7B]|nr:SRPBCC family protein [Blastococcus sp. TML/C7B]